MTTLYWCDLIKDSCRHGGTKYFNYGFVQGTAGYCYLARRWVTQTTALCNTLKECPKGRGKEKRDGERGS